MRKPKLDMRLIHSEMGLSGHYFSFDILSYHIDYDHYVMYMMLVIRGQTFTWPVISVDGVLCEN